MKINFFEKKQITEPKIHEDVDNINLSDGAHILINCKNAVLTGTACVMESTDSDYIEVSGKSKIQIFHSGRINLLKDRAKIGMVKKGVIEKMTTQKLAHSTAEASNFWIKNLKFQPLIQAKLCLCLCATTQKLAQSLMAQLMV